MILYTKMPAKDSNDVIIWQKRHENEIKLNIRISTCMPYIYIVSQNVLSEID